MKTETRNRIFFAFLLIFVTVVVYNHSDTFYDNEVKAKYYEIISIVEKLYENHEVANGHYYNGEFTNKEDLEKYLEPHMTEDAIKKVVEDIFKESDKQLVYTGNLQEYLVYGRGTQDHLNYYTAIKDTILNPGLKLVLENQIEIEKEGNEYIARIKETVHFYDETQEQFQYVRLGFPPVDLIHVKFRFIEKDGKIFLKDYRVVMNGQEKTKV